MKIIIILMLFIPLRINAPNPQVSDDLAILQFKNHLNKMKFELFLSDLAHQETGSYKNPWTITNSLGAKGKWQLTDIALEDIGCKNVNKFLSDTNLQKECVVKLIKRNYKQVNKFVGKKVHGITITTGGLLAACHLAGVGGFKKFIYNGYNATDGNGSVKKWLIEFSKHEFEI